MKLLEIIKKHRESNGLSMQEFADRCGLSKGYISMLESGKHPQNNRPLTPSIVTYQKIAKGMGIPLEDLLRLVDGDEPVSVGADSASTLHDLAYRTAVQQQLLEGFDRLTDVNKGRVLQYVETLLENQEKKTDSSLSSAG